MQHPKVNSFLTFANFAALLIVPNPGEVRQQKANRKIRMFPVKFLTRELWHIFLNGCIQVKQVFLVELEEPNGCQGFADACNPHHYGYRGDSDIIAVGDR